jgi:hypothetical protein
MPNVFADLRSKYFELARPPGDPWHLRESAPWGVIMEVAYSAAIVTTVVFSDGTVSVLSSTGGGFFGGGDDAVQRAGKGFLMRADSHLPFMRSPKEYSAPDIGSVRFFVRVNDDVLCASEKEADLQKHDHPLFQFYCAGIRILHEYLVLQKRTPQAAKQ